MVQGSSSSPGDRRRLVVVGGVVAVAAALIGIGTWTMAPRTASVSDVTGARLSIDVVAPVEPLPDPGGILEVGALNDGFDRAALDRPAEVTSTDHTPPEAYVGEDWPLLEPIVDTRPKIHQVATAQEPKVTSTDPLADGSRLFGFDRRPARITSAAPAESADLQTEPAKTAETFFE